MKLSLQESLIEVWRQALVENAKVVALGTKRYPVRLTPKHHLRPVDFVFDGNKIRGLEQNPDTKSRWAQMARAGKKVMQFSEGRYVANVVDGKVTLYGTRAMSNRLGKHKGTGLTRLFDFLVQMVDDFGYFAVADC